ncbi:MAG: phosphoribosylformylglycinamidine cyclo-ligase [Candidatus Dormibacteria bacterium]
MSSETEGLPAPSQYARAGVDRGRAEHAIRRVAELAATTHLPPLLAGIGPFAAIWRLPDSLPPGSTLVSSTDSVGTKTKVAVAMGRHRGIGQDIVNHCVNDVLTTGATPLFFLDYFATGRIEPDVLEQVAEGMTEACRLAGCSLVGGETAEMPGVYGIGDYDLAGFLVGTTTVDRLLGAHLVRAGDILLGIPSSGLHTNGYSLVRHLLAEREMEYSAVLPGTDRGLGELLLEPHRSYLDSVLRLRELGEVHALAHITGGGIVENLPRVLPDGVSAEIIRSSWQVPALFSALQELGNISEPEMWRTFNMGIGMICAVPESTAARAVTELGLLRIGEVVASSSDDRVVLS